MSFSSLCFNAVHLSSPVLPLTQGFERDKLHLTIETKKKKEMTTVLEEQPISDTNKNRPSSAFLNQRAQPDGAPYDSMQQDGPISRALTAWLAGDQSVSPQILDGKDVEEESVYVFCATAATNGAPGATSCFQYSAVSPLRFQKILQPKSQRRVPAVDVNARVGPVAAGVNTSPQWKTVLVLVAPTGCRFPDLDRSQGRIIRLDLRIRAFSKLNAIDACKYYSHYREYINTPSAVVAKRYSTFQRPLDSADCFHFATVNREEEEDDDDDTHPRITEKTAGKRPLIRVQPALHRCELEKDFVADAIPWFRKWNTPRDRYSDKMRYLTRAGRAVKEKLRHYMSRLRR